MMARRRARFRRHAPRKSASRSVAGALGMAACIIMSCTSALAHTGGGRAPEPAAQSLNMAWVLVSGFLVMFMQVGFAMLETGFTRAKNAVNTMAMNLVIYPIGLIGFWLAGYALMMGGVTQWPSLGTIPIAHRELALQIGAHRYGLLGFGKFALVTVSHDPASLAMFLFAVVFMDTAATIPTGAMAERWKFSAFFVYGFFMSMFLYPLYGNWVWGGGWLSQLGVNLGLGHGHVDFAGSSVVHMTGGVIALVGAWLLGPRRGKYNADGTPNAIPGHNIPMALVGTFILCFGWFGFNPGSTLAGSDLRIGVIATNTMLAGAAGGVTAMLYVWRRYGKPDPSMLANGTLAGLVAITAPCAFVTAPAAVLIGGVAGVLVCIAVFFIDGKLRIDDPVGAISVHGVNGLWGILALGLLADGTYGDGWNGVNGAVRGLFYGDASQFVAQAIGGIANFVGVGAMAFIAYKVTAFVVGGHRVAPAVEELGLDLPEMGALAYPDTHEIGSAVILSETASHGAGHLEPEPEAA